MSSKRKRPSFRVEIPYLSEDDEFLVEALANIDAKNAARKWDCSPTPSIALDPRWLTSTVVDLATAIYHDLAFDRLPILADALMDVGCDSDEIIAHCRSNDAHVRGCWVMGLLLGKK